MRHNSKSVLLKTCSNADLQYGDGEIAVTGLPSVPLKDLLSVKQTKYRVEVPQVVTLGDGTYTPEAETVYRVIITDPNRSVSGRQSPEYVYDYKTPEDLTEIGANAAEQREAIHGYIIDKINNATSINRSTAVTLGGGTGFTVTDNGGYYPVRSQTMTNVLGPNVVRTAKVDGAGFPSAGTVTTAAIIGFGVGAKLAEMQPIIDFKFGGITQGELDAPVAIDGTYATAGQNYDCFQINSLQKEEAPTITGHYTYIVNTQKVYFDNGAGTSTANLTGAISFETAMLKLATIPFRNDSNAQIDFFDNLIIFQGAGGAVPSGTDAAANKMIGSGANASWTITNIGAQTTTTPTPTNTGLLVDQDLTTTEGTEYTPSLATNCTKEFVIGKTGYTFSVRLTAADWTDTAWQVGVRKKEAVVADFNNYNDMASIGTLAANGDLIRTEGILNNAGTVSTSTGVIPVDGASIVVTVIVAKSGRVTCKVNGTTYPIYSVGTTPLILDSGDVFIPFFRQVNVGGGDPDLTVMRAIGVASETLIG